jgi:hypothetical protein
MKAAVKGSQRTSSNEVSKGHKLGDKNIPNRAAQTGVFDLNIRISNRPSIDVCKSFAAETGLKSRNVEKRINAG